MIEQEPALAGPAADLSGVRYEPEFDFWKKR
jgi:hypothetical protein